MSDTVDVRRTPVIVDVHKCARCGDDHPQLQFHPLYNAPDDITHWTLCPAIGQPILLFATVSDERPTVEQRRNADEVKA